MEDTRISRWGLAGIGLAQGLTLYFLTEPSWNDSALCTLRRPAVSGPTTLIGVAGSGAQDGATALMTVSCQP